MDVLESLSEEISLGLLLEGRGRAAGPWGGQPEASAPVFSLHEAARTAAESRDSGDHRGYGRNGGSVK